jgi:hypothetical protein
MLRCRPGPGDEVAPLRWSEAPPTRPRLHAAQVRGQPEWSYEEDIYNPAHFKDMVRGWMDRKKKIAEG